jgi:predicted PurR-regulated permease PerM
VKERLGRRLGDRPGPAALLTTLGTVILLGAVLGAAGFSVTNRLTALYQEFGQSSLEEGGWPALAAASADRVIDAVASRLPIDKDAIHAEMVAGMKRVSGYLVSNIGIAINEVTGLLFNGLLVTLFLYFLLRYGRDMVLRLGGMTPLDSRTAGNIRRTIHDSVIANVNGMLAVAAGQGILLILGFWIVGVRSPVLWGALGGLASIVPVIGAVLVWSPVAIGFLVMGVWWKGLLLALWGMVVVGSADNVIRSVVVGAREKQHPMLVALAAIGGTFAFGILGILLGPLMVSLAAALLGEIRQLVAAGKEAERDGAAVPGPGEPGEAGPADAGRSGAPVREGERPEEPPAAV